MGLASILWRERDSSLMHQGPALQLGPWRGPRLDAMGRQPRSNGIVVQEIEGNDLAVQAAGMKKEKEPYNE